MFRYYSEMVSALSLYGVQFYDHLSEKKKAIGKHIFLKN